MSDVAEVKEAIKHDLEPSIAEFIGPASAALYRRTRTAARRWVRMVSEGEVVWRCDTHRSDASVPPSDDGWVSCWYAANHLAHNPQARMEPCRIVPRLVAAVGVEKEIGDEG